MATTLFRYFPRDTFKTATVRHIGTSAGPQEFPGAAEETVYGALVQMSRYQRALLGNDLRIKWLFFIDDGAVLREGDKVTIDGLEYLCSNVDLYDYGSIKHKAVTLSKP